MSDTTKEARVGPPTEQALNDAIKTVLAGGLAVADMSLDTWLVKEELFEVDGTGRDSIEEDFTDADVAIKYFLMVMERTITP